MQFTVPCASGPVRVDLIEPPGTGPHPALVLLHGAGGNSSFWLDQLAPFANRLGLAIFAVRYFDTTGTSRADAAMLADGVHVPRWLAAIKLCTDAIRQRPGVDSRRVALVGISLGAFLSLALAAQGLAVRAVVEISGGLVPPYEAQATASFPPVLLLHGEQDSIVPVAMAHALAATLARLGVTHVVELLPGEGHWFSAAAQARISSAITRFLAQHL